MEQTDKALEYSTLNFEGKIVDRTFVKFAEPWV